MKFPFTIFTLLFTMALSSTSFAEWTKKAESIKGDTYYLDFERIRKHDGYVYYWTLGDYSTPTKEGFSSSVDYWRGDCELFRLKNLTQIGYQEQMGQGERLRTVDTEDIGWTYPNPDSVHEILLKNVCSR